jgi:sulfur carrier protein
MIEVTINGEAQTIEVGLTVASLLARFNIVEKMVVVDLNGEIVTRSQFAETSVAAGDTLEIVQMMAGG